MICTTIEQSKALAKILSEDSADMVWIEHGYCKRLLPKEDIDANAYPVITPSWSLDALLEYLRKDYYVKLERDIVYWAITCIKHNTTDRHNLYLFDNAIDACYAMILKLNNENGL